MAKKTEFDQAAAHKYYSASCFNQAWDLIDKEDRTQEEDEQMIRLSLASHYHWTQRPDYSHTGASIGHWQTSRIYAILGQAENAMRYGQLCLQVSQGEDVGPFFLGYAYEALARAAALAGDRDSAAGYLESARTAADQVKEVDERKMLLDDLKTIALD